MTNERTFMTTEQYHNKRRERQRLEGLWWAIVLIWAGLVIAAERTGLLPQIGDASAWSWIFLGAGVVGILGSSYRVTAVNAPNPTTWDWVWGSICLIIGMDALFTLSIFWPLFLILVGGAILVKGLWRRD